MFIWNMHSGEVIGPFTHHGVSQDVVVSLIFSADARHVTSAASNYSLCVWNPMTGNIVRGPVGLSNDQKVYATSSSWSIALTQDGQRVAFIGNHFRILVFEVVYIGNSDISLCGPLVLGGHTYDITCIAFSRDGQRLATTSNDHTIRTWDIQAAEAHKQTSDSSELPNFNEVFIDNDGWATYTSRGGLPLRLMWIPDTHRWPIYFPTSVCEMGGNYRKETRLNLEKFVHGKDWVMCKT